MEMFKEWFEYSLFTMILDTQDSGIEKTWTTENEWIPLKALSYQSKLITMKIYQNAWKAESGTLNNYIPKGTPDDTLIQ